MVVFKLSLFVTNQYTFFTKLNASMHNPIPRTMATMSGIESMIVTFLLGFCFVNELMKIIHVIMYMSNAGW